MNNPAGQRTGEDALLNEILSDATRKAERAIQKAEEEAREILDKARREAGEISTAAAAGASERSEREKMIILATTGVEAKRLEIDSKEALIGQVFDAARKSIMDQGAADYPALVARLIAGAAKIIGGDTFVIALSNDDSASLNLADLRTRASDRLGRSISLTLGAPAPIRAGVIVHSGDGHLLVDNSLEGRLARMHDALRREAAQILFEGKA